MALELKIMGKIKKKKIEAITYYDAKQLCPFQKTKLRDLDHCTDSTMSMQMLLFQKVIDHLLPHQFYTPDSF